MHFYSKTYIQCIFIAKNSCLFILRVKFIFKEYYSKIIIETLDNAISKYKSS